MPPRLTKKKQESPPKQRAIIYARVSTQEQREEGYSIEAQISLLEGYCIAKGLEVTERVVESETARSTGRPGFAKMLNLVQKGGAEVIVVEKTDRLYRNMTDRVKVDETGAEVHLVKENTVISKTSRSHEKFVHDIKLVVAKNYSDNLSEEAKKGMLEKAKAGIWPSHAPTGYLNVARDGKRIIEQDPEMAPRIRRVFELYATGDYSIRDLAAEAKLIGLVTHKGRSFSPSNIQYLIHHPLYRGLVPWGGALHQGTHEPIVDAELWRRVERVAGIRSAGSQATSAKEYAYKGLVRCSCGCLMTPYTAKGKYVYYACSGYKGCTRRGIREEIITDAIADQFDGLVIKDQFIGPLRQALTSALGTVRTEHQQATEFLVKRAQVLEKKIENAYVDQIEGRLPQNAYRSLLTTWTAELDETNEALRISERAKHRTWDDIAVFIDLLSNLGNRFKSANLSAKREMAKNALSNCTIEGGKVQIELDSWFKLVWDANTRCGENSQVFNMAGYIERLAYALLEACAA